MSDSIHERIATLKKEREDGLLLITEFGSTLYGTRGPNSDTDYKGIFVPTFRELVLNPRMHSIQFSTGKQNEKNSSDDVDFELYTLSYFCQLAMEGQTIGIDMLFSEKKHWLFFDERIQQVFDARGAIISKKVMKFIQYAQHQAAKYGIKGSRLHAAEKVLDFLSGLPLTDKDDKFINHLDQLSEFVKQHRNETNESFFDLQVIRNGMGQIIPHESYLFICGKKFMLSSNPFMAFKGISKFVSEYGSRAVSARNNEGVDLKAISHAFRSAYQVKHIIEDGGFSYPLPETKFLVMVKNGEIPYYDLAPMLENLIDTTKKDLDNSSLPDEPDYDFVDYMLVNIHRDSYFKKK